MKSIANESTVLLLNVDMDDMSVTDSADRRLPVAVLSVFSLQEQVALGSHEVDFHF